MFWALLKSFEDFKMTFEDLKVGQTNLHLLKLYCIFHCVTSQKSVGFNVGKNSISLIKIHHKFNSNQNKNFIIKYMTKECNNFSNLYSHTFPLISSSTSKRQCSSKDLPRKRKQKNANYLYKHKKVIKVIKP